LKSQSDSPLGHKIAPEGQDIIPNGDSIAELEEVAFVSRGAHFRGNGGAVPRNRNDQLGDLEEGGLPYIQTDVLEDEFGVCDAPDVFSGKVVMRVIVITGGESANMPFGFSRHRFGGFGAEVDVVDDLPFQQRRAEVHFPLLKAEKSLLKVHKEMFTPDNEVFPDEVDVSEELELLGLQVSLHVVGADAIAPKFKFHVVAFQGFGGGFQVFKAENPEDAFRFTGRERRRQAGVSGGIEGKS
jgi:hypothetical protein